MSPSIDDIYKWLDEVKDPEIPVLSLVDLGVITLVSLENDSVQIEMTPTFVGCPALDFMKSEIVTVLRNHGINKVHIDVTFREAWTSGRISDKGRKALKEYGLAPPPAVFTDLDVLDHVACPRCDGFNTVLRTPFGPTLCRAIHYCNDCREAFEQFKPL